MNSLEFKFTKKEINSKVIVEAGHIYVNEAPAQEHELSAKIGSQIVQTLASLGYETTNWLFIDDYNPSFEEKPVILDELKYKKLIAELGFTPEIVVHESELVHDAELALKFLISKGYAEQNYETGIYLLNKGNVMLYNSKLDKYMCALLDACLYLEKEKSGNCLITVLEEQYKPQQKGTMAILKKLGMETDKILPVFYHSPILISHESVNLNNVYSDIPEGNEDSKIAIPDIILMLKLLGKVSNSILVETPLNLEVLNYVQ